jgi:hypothetical protein
MSAWIQHVKDYRADHPELSYKEAMVKAKATYSRKAKPLGKYAQKVVAEKKIAKYYEGEYKKCRKSSKGILRELELVKKEMEGYVELVKKYEEEKARLEELIKKKPPMPRGIIRRVPPPLPPRPTRL